MLRAANIKKSSLNEIVQISDIENLKEITSFFKSIAIQTAKYMINEESKTKLPPNFGKCYLNFILYFKNLNLKIF